MIPRIVRTFPRSGLWLFLPVLLLAVWLSACASLNQPSPQALPHPQAGRVWARFQNSTQGEQPLPFWIRASLVFSSPEESRRTTFEFWGNADLPLRLDLKAGLGMTFAHWRVDEAGLVAYYPGQETAYLHPDSSKGLKYLGFPCPFSMQELARILNGQWTQCVPQTYTRVSPKPQGLSAFFFDRDQRIQTLVLDRKGRVVSVHGPRPFPWSLHVDDYQRMGDITLAQTFRLTTSREEKAVVRLKKARRRSTPWPSRALNLPLPEDTIRRPLGS